MGINERKEREKERRRGEIIDAAEKVFFSKDVESATMDDVAVEAELSKGTLYLYFKNKNELLHAIVARAMEVLLELFKKVIAQEGRGLDKVRGLGRAYFEFYKTEPDYFAIMFHREKQIFDPEAVEGSPNVKYCNDLGNEIFTLMGEAVRIGMEDGSIREDLDPKMLSLVLWGHSAGILNLVRTKESLFETQFQVNTRDVIEYSTELIGYYLRNPEYEYGNDKSDKDKKEKARKKK
jgi:AcrR family transcriptional regulator